MTAPALPDGLVLFPYQETALEDIRQQLRQGVQPRLCLYHRTGAGKTITSLLCVRETGAQQVLVVAPPITQDKWVAQGVELGMTVTAVSHAKFRMKDFKIRRDTAIIVDEFHMLGGHTGMGWKKLDRLAPGLQAPLIICSATPNYNDAERVYCVQHVMDPHSVKGGYIQFLYSHCETSVNPFASTPLVDGFKHFADAEDYLAALEHVHYVEDEIIKTVSIIDVDSQAPELPESYLTYGLDRTGDRLMASQMEGRHYEKRWFLLDDRGEFRDVVFDKIIELAAIQTTPVLLYCDSSVIAEALHRLMNYHGDRALLITGKTTTPVKQAIVDEFKRGGYEALIGTASMSTGTDGIDKMCDTLIIVDDTSDDSLRRQLMGRILPRGEDADASGKEFLRLVHPR